MNIDSTGDGVDVIIRERLTDIPNIVKIHDDITIARNRETHETALRSVFK